MKRPGRANPLTGAGNVWIRCAMQSSCPQMPGEAGPDELSTEQVRSTYAHLPFTLAVVVVNASLISFVLATAAPEAAVLRWWAAVLLLTVLRCLLWLAQRRFDTGQSSRPIWHRLAIAGS